MLTNKLGLRLTASVLQPLLMPRQQIRLFSKLSKAQQAYENQPISDPRIQQNID